MIRSLALFLHLAGTLALFGGFAVEWFAATGSIERLLRRFYGIGAATILLSGIFLTWREHSFGLAWVRVSMGMLFLMGLLGALRRAGSLPLRVAIGLAALFMMTAKVDLTYSLVIAAVGISVGLTATYLAPNT
jgi:hypothetical protein